LSLEKEVVEADAGTRLAPWFSSRKYSTPKVSRFSI
jgi:hypothetical protein